VDKCSVYEEGQKEADRFKWIESEKAGCDLGETAIRRWVKDHWCGYLRALLQRTVRDQDVLLDRILDRLKAGQENLDVIVWALDWEVPMERVLEILELLDINSRRLAHRFDL
jgi:hypothetical protein